jgi:outer membrane protein assembly factor BamB
VTVNTTSKAGGAVITRRAALLAPLAVSGCSWFDDWFSEKKTSLPGKRESIFVDRRGLVVDDTAPKVVLPAAVRNAPGRRPAAIRLT